MKKKILWYSDSPTVSTGFGNVARNIIKRLGSQDDYEITVVGINSDGHAYDRDEYPCEIIPAMSFSPLNSDGDVYGKSKLMHFLMQDEWDYLVIMQDTFVVEKMGGAIKEAKAQKLKAKQKVFEFVYYFPADAPFHPNWIKNSIAIADIPVSYNKYGVDVTLDQQKNLTELAGIENKMRVIHHGVDTDVFKPMPKDQVMKFREAYFMGKVAPDDYLIINVNRNQQRKDLARTLMAFKYIKQEIPNAKLYTHCLVDEGRGTGSNNLEEIARRINLDTDSWLRPHPNLATPGMGMPESNMNLLYNAADLNISTSMGEGWGLSSTEAMACKTLNIMPKHTSFPEIIGENEERGLLAEAGNTPSHFSAFGMYDNSVVRPLVDVDSLVEKVVYAYNYPEEMQTKIDAAYEWVTSSLEWDSIVDEWEDIFKQ